MVDGYSVTEAASVLGVPTERVWELLARGIISGTPDGESGMRVFLQSRPAPRSIDIERPDPAPPPRSEPESSPFRELLTEFRNLTERYGQALLALGESRGEVSSLRSRVDMLEARIELRLPMSAPVAQPVPEPATAGPWDAARSPMATLAPGAEPAEPLSHPAPVTESEAAAAKAPRRRRGRGHRRATDDFAEALARAEDPNPAELPGAAEASAALAALREDAAAADAEAATVSLPREMPAAESFSVVEAEPEPVTDEAPMPEPPTTAADAAIPTIEHEPEPISAVALEPEPVASVEPLPEPEAEVITRAHDEPEPAPAPFVDEPESAPVAFADEPDVALAALADESDPAPVAFADEPDVAFTALADEPQPASPAFREEPEPAPAAFADEPEPLPTAVADHEALPQSSDASVPAAEHEASAAPVPEVDAEPWPERAVATAAVVDEEAAQVATAAEGEAAPSEPDFEAAAAEPDAAGAPDEPGDEAPWDQDRYSAHIAEPDWIPEEPAPERAERVRADEDTESRGISNETRRGAEGGLAPAEEAIEGPESRPWLDEEPVGGSEEPAGAPNVESSHDDERRAWTADRERSTWGRSIDSPQGGTGGTSARASSLPSAGTSFGGLAGGAPSAAAWSREAQRAGAPVGPASRAYRRLRRIFPG